MLAAALITYKDHSKPGAAEIAEAKALATEAAKLNARDSYPQAVLAQIAIASEDLDLLRSATAKLEVLAPDEPVTHMYRVSIAATEGNWSEARTALEKARAAGLPPNAYAEMK